MSASIVMSRTHSRASYLAFCLILAAFLLRSLIPAGFMPASHSDIQHGMALDICHAGEYVPAALSDPGPAPDKNATDTCLFGLYNATSAGLLADLPGLLPTQLVFVAARLPVYFYANASRIDGPPVGSRAPPSLASSHN